MAGKSKAFRLIRQAWAMVHEKLACPTKVGIKASFDAESFQIDLVRIENGSQSAGEPAENVPFCVPGHALLLPYFLLRRQSSSEKRYCF
jgi:hypothetical protein